MIEGGPQPYEARIAFLAQTFSATPGQIEEEDEQLLSRAVTALIASRAVDNFAEKRKLNDAEASLYNSMMDALDLDQIEAGIPEEQ